MPRFSKTELKVMKDPSLTLQQKAEALNRSMSSVRSKHWVLNNKPSKRPARRVKRESFPAFKREIKVQNTLDISIDSTNRRIILNY